MSEEPAPSPEPRRRGRRFAIRAGGAALIAIAVTVALGRTWHRAAPVGTVERRDGGAAIHAPIGPSVPALPATGVRLTGFVVDGAGLPVAGAEVTAELERGPADRALAPAVADAGVADAGVSHIAVSPPSGPDGRFAIEGLEPGRFRLHVTGPGLLAAEVRFVPVPSDAARIVVARQVAIEGTVSDGGKPVAGALVGIRGDAIGGTLELRADGQGKYSAPNLPEGRYQVYAWKEALAARTVRVNRLGAGPFAAVELRLEAAAIVVGRVIDRAEGTGLVAAVELRPSGDDQAPRYARSGEDGVFRIEGVPNGRWIADAFVPGYQSPGGVELEAGHGVPELALAHGAAVEGRVLDGDGNPVAGATVRALVTGAATHNAASPTEISAQVDQDWLRRFSGRTAAPPPEAVPGADPQLIARGELGVMIGPIPPLPPPGAEIARSAIVEPVAGGSLVGEPPPLPTDPARASIWVTGPDGRYRIRGLGKGKVTVLAAAAGFAEARSRQVAVGGAETVTGVDLALSAGTYLVGKVTDQHGAPVIGAELSAQPELGTAVEGFSDSDGMYRLGPVTGTIELRAAAYGHVEVQRKVELAAARGPGPAERREDLVLEVADAILAGTLDDASGAPVPGAHLEIIGGSGEGRHAVVAADGTFAIDMLPRGPLRVRVDHPAYPPDELSATASVTGERVRLRLPLGGGVEGALLDGSSGEPLASLTVTGAGPGGVTADASTDKAGRWKLVPLRPGRWRIDVKQPGYLPQSRELDVPTARAPGETSVRDVRIELARGALVGGTVRDARGQRVPGAHVVIKPAAGSGPTVEGDTDAQGEFRIRDAPTGELSITATHGDAGGSLRATVRPGDEILGLALDVR